MTATLPAGFRREGDGRLRPAQLFADPTLDQPFWNDGFVHTPMLSPEELRALRARFAELAPYDGFDPTTIDGARCTYHCTFLDPDRAYRRQADELVREFFASKLEAVMPGYKILCSNFYVKPSGLGRFEIHQNWPTLEDLDVPTVTAWVPLQDTWFGNGTIRVVRGSHHVFPDVAAATAEKFFQEFETELIENYLEPVNVSAGQAFIFDDSLLHWSGANRSEHPRVTIQIEMIPTDSKAVLWIQSPQDATAFDLWEMDKEFWIEYPIDSVYAEPQGLPNAGRRPSPNRRLTFEEFEAAMRRQDEIRREKYAFD